MIRRRVRGRDGSEPPASGRLSQLDGWHRLPVPVVAFDIQGAVCWLNEAACVLGGYRADDVLGWPIEELMHVGDPGIPGLRELLVRGEGGEATRAYGATLHTSDGPDIAVDVDVGPLVLDGQRCALALLHDARTHAVALAESEERFRIAFARNLAPMFLTDPDDRIVDVNEAFCALIGFSANEIVGRSAGDFTSSGEHERVERSPGVAFGGDLQVTRRVTRHVHRNGSVVVVEAATSPVIAPNGSVRYYVTSERDLTQQEELSEQLARRALYDPLTGLANRTLFEDRLGQAHARVVRHGGIGAVLLVDLDGFKGVNDSLGHLAGDDLLVQVAERLQRVTRASDTLCRFAGDEFLYLAEGLITSDEVESLARRLHEALREAFLVGDLSIEQRASIGVVVWDATTDADISLIQSANVAMYEAKKKRQGGGSHHVVFTPGMHEKVASRFTLLQDLRQSLHQDQLRMYYQPIVNLATGDIVGFEALMRWHHPQRGWVAPDVFIPLAEKSDLIVELGVFALGEALEAARTWTDTGAPGPSFVTVNLSAHQFLADGLIATIEGLLAQRGFSPNRLVLEITEGVPLSDVDETVRVMSDLADIGVAVALDDFGTGYTSLSYLTRLRPNFIKIDQSFVNPTHESDPGGAVLESIISLGERINVTMLAEGIETRDQLERVRGFGCQLGQGYLFSPAVPAGEVHSLFALSSKGWW
ncbi:MAG TPA: EAL domain-containing protein [Acidimicrobiales bacterium]|nr:EAL domain-containing protein [Acidimicrobiales bacterium]